MAHVPQRVAMITGLGWAFAFGRALRQFHLVQLLIVPRPKAPLPFPNQPPLITLEHRIPRLANILYLSRTATGLIALTILALTILPAVTMPSPTWLTQVDKLYHMMAFAALVITAALLDHGAVSWMFIGGLILGAAIEFIQPSVGRDADVMDFLADAAGLVLGLGFGWLLRRTFGPQEPR